MSEFIPGRNGVLEALKSGHSINKIFFAEGNQEGSIKQIIAIAKAKKIPTSVVPKNKLNEMFEGNHQGVIAAVASHDYVDVDDILAAAKDKGEAPFILMLAELESPQNLGAIMRSADIAGVHGIIISKNNSVGLNATVAKVSAGATEYVPVARVSNLVQTAKYLKEQGLWVYGADMAGTSLWEQEIKGAILMVIGGEDRGIPRLLLENCDFKLSIPMQGHISSLNAGAAAAIMMFEVVRQKT
ncbi:MAG: 23S rRNA (guanosine(2251)-2'-O)-methyltransferase RlmB, partial [Clostridiales bacterium]